MQLYPTIHIKNGKCFNPSSDASDKQNIFTSSPIKLAKIWEDAGASCIHIVDVDGAVMGYPIHDDLIREIARSVNIPIQVGGGIRTIKDIDHILNGGAQRVVCATQAVQSNRFVEEAVAFFGSEHFVAGIDAVNGMVAIEGRERLSKYNPISLINGMGECGVATVIYTDIYRSSLHEGPSIDNTRELVARTNVKVIYGGGVASLSDLEAISQINVEGVIIASSLYNGDVDLKEAIDIFEKGMTGNEN